MDKSVCSVNDCGNPVLARGWCNKHYSRWQKYGDVNHPVRPLLPRGATNLDRFWAKVDRSAGPDGCWVWTGYCARYGSFWNGEHRPDGAPVMVRAHRWIYEQIAGPAGELNVLHRCDNPPCVNPGHLFLGTQSDNMQDMMSKGRRGAQPTCPAERRARGAANNAAKITDETVRLIRQTYAEGQLSQQAIATLFGITQTNVSAIVLRKIWQHID